MNGEGYVEYGQMIDCEKNGCTPFHSDHGRIYSWNGNLFGEPDLTQDATINNHATSWRQRTWPEWEVVEN